MLGAIATALSGGSFAAAFVCGLTFAAKSAVTGAVMGAVIGGLSAAFSGENVLEGALSGFADGFYDGFMWGGITAGLGNVIKPGSFCFVAGTKVLTDRGHKNIEDIEVGDLVLAYDEETGETAYKPVLHLFRNTTNEWCTVSVRGNDGEFYEITSTPGHKYFVPENKVRKDSRALEHASYAELSEKWVSACDLKHGDKVLLFDGTLCKVESVSCRKLSAPETTYNLEVADFHTYYVSDACVLVHNAGPCGRSGSYDIEFKSGKHYIGKGSVRRMNQSARRIARQYGDDVVSKHWKMAENSRKAFMQEAQWMQDASSRGISLYNKIASPGFKILGIKWIR